jgi:hypothetical protein
MRRDRLKALFLVPILVLLIAAKPLVDPAPIEVPAGLTEKAVAKSIRRGVATRGWVVTQQEPGFMEATLHLRTHVAKIGIKYDTRSIQINYLESQNLDFEVKKDVRYIHRNYLKWVDNVVNDIRVQLTVAAEQGEGD